MEARLSGIDVGRLSKVVAEQLQEKIIRGGMAVGDRLPTEPELMEEFGVSRTVVREAAALLVSRGVVEVRPRRGMTVRAPDGQGLAESLAAQLRMSGVSLPQLLQVRLTLECAMARLAAAERTDEDMATIAANLDAMGSGGVEQARLVELDLQFHDLVATATHNPFFLLVMRPINGLLRSLYVEKAGYMTMRETTVGEHREIFAAIVRRDGDAADLATRRHLERVGHSVQRLLAGLALDTD